MKSICSSEGFWSKLQCLSEILAHFQVAISLAEADKPISNVWKLWVDVYLVIVIIFT